MNNPQQQANPINNTANTCPRFNPYLQRTQMQNGTMGYPQAGYMQTYPMIPMPLQNQPDASSNKLFSLISSGSTQRDLIKGALIGATATFLLTNKDAQRVIFKNFAKISSLLEMGIEEMKERYEDAKAEVAE